MSLLLGSLTLGFIFSFIALGVYISFRIFAFPDITADGSSTLGAAVAAMLLVHSVNPVLATVAAFAGGFVAGTFTGTLATKFKINGLLAGILVMTESVPTRHGCAPRKAARMERPKTSPAPSASLVVDD